MKLDFLTDKELFKLAAHQDEYNEYIDKEWFRRYGLSFPYQQSQDEDKVYNILLDQVMTFEECDKMIVRQAVKLREKDLNKLNN